MRWVLGFVIMALGLGFAAVVWLSTLQPLTMGSMEGYGQQLLLGVRDAADVLGTDEDIDRVVTYRYEPGGRFAVLFTVRNTSPVPVTVLDSATPIEVMEGNMSFWMEDLAAVIPGQTSGSEASALDGPPLPPTVVAPDEELQLWARYRITAICDGEVPWEPAPDWPGGDGYSSASRSSVTVRSEVFGIPQTSTIQLRDEVEMVNGGPDAVLECPAPA